MSVHAVQGGQQNTPRGKAGPRKAARVGPICASACLRALSRSGLALDSRCCSTLQPSSVDLLTVCRELHAFFFFCFFSQLCWVLVIVV